MSTLHVSLATGLLALAACGDHGGGDVGSISTPQGRLWGARFSPASNVISVAYGDEDKIGTIDLEALTLRELTPGGSYLSGTAWSPSGDAIYFNGTDGIVRIETDIGSSAPVNDSFATLGIDVSPDGKKLAYGVNGSNARIYTIADHDEQALARPCQAIRFAPAGDKVACITGGALVTIDLTTGAETTIIAEDLPFIAGCDWYADGQALIVTTTNGLEKVTLDGQTDLVQNAFAATEVDLSPDEHAIIYGQNGRPDLTLLRL